MKMKAYRLISVISKTMVAGLALLVLVPTMVLAKSENAGLNQPNPNQPFVSTSVATFKYPWSIAFLPNGCLLVTEKPGKLFIVTQKGLKTEVAGIPKVYYRGQNGMLDVAVSPTFVRDHSVYFTFVEPARSGGTLVLARARLQESDSAASLADLVILWRQNQASSGGQHADSTAKQRGGRVCAAYSAS